MDKQNLGESAINSIVYLILKLPRYYDKYDAETSESAMRHVKILIEEFLEKLEGVSPAEKDLFFNALVTELDEGSYLEEPVLNEDDEEVDFIERMAEIFRDFGSEGETFLFMLKNTEEKIKLES